MSQSKEKQQEDPTQASNEQQKKPLTRQKRTERWFEVITALMLGAVAVATAWSGYQATHWSGEQASHYSQAGALRVESTRDSTLAGQLMLYDVNLFNEWLNAYSHGETKLTGIYQRRFRSEFLPAFQAWLATDPFQQSECATGAAVYATIQDQPFG